MPRVGLLSVIVAVCGQSHLCELYRRTKETLHAKYLINYSEGNKITYSSLKYSYILANMPDKQKSINSNNPDALLKVLVMCNLTKF